jgi:hypothetical protein
MPVQAQFKFGVTGGMNISQFHVSDDTYEAYVDRNRGGFIIGPTVIYTIPKVWLGFDLSALYDLRGAKSKSLSDSESISCKSFQIPFNVRYGLNFDDMIYAFVFTGPQFGFNLGNKESLIASGTGKTSGHAMERRWVNNSSSFSWNFGIGGVFLDNVQVRISYNLALRKSGEIQQIDLVDNSQRTLTDGKVSSCQVAVSYLF